MVAHSTVLTHRLIGVAMPSWPSGVGWPWAALVYLVFADQVAAQLVGESGATQLNIVSSMLAKSPRQSEVLGVAESRV